VVLRARGEEWAEVANRAVALAISQTEVDSWVEVVGSDLRVWSLVISLTEPKTWKPGSSWRLKKLNKTPKSVSCTHKI
jgi:hypothetical protein